MISHLQHTNVSAISKELSDLLASNGSLSSSRVLTQTGHSQQGEKVVGSNPTASADHAQSLSAQWLEL